MHDGVARSALTRARVHRSKARDLSVPHKSPKCLKCHVRGYDAPFSVSNKVTPTEGGGCEACHGPCGALHGFKTDFDVSQLETRAQYCQRCHNQESPTCKGFDLESFSKVIAHWSHQQEVEMIRRLNMMKRR